MRIVKTQQDIEDLCRDGAAPAALTKHIVGFFRQLETELADDEEGVFHLNQHGPIILLEVGDNLRSLNVAGLSGDDLCQERQELMKSGCDNQPTQDVQVTRRRRRQPLGAA